MPWRRGSASGRQHQNRRLRLRRVRGGGCARACPLPRGCTRRPTAQSTTTVAARQTCCQCGPTRCQRRCGWRWRCAQKQQSGQETSEKSSAEGIFLPLLPRSRRMRGLTSFALHGEHRLGGRSNRWGCRRVCSCQPGQGTMQPQYPSTRPTQPPSDPLPFRRAERRTRRCNSRLLGKARCQRPSPPCTS
jgi:hypothetical protein